MFVEIPTAVAALRDKLQLSNSIFNLHFIEAVKNFSVSSFKRILFILFFFYIHVVFILS